MLMSVLHQLLHTFTKMDLTVKDVSPEQQQAENII